MSNHAKDDISSPWLWSSMSDEYLTVPESIDLERKIDKPPEGNKNTVKYDFTDHGFLEIKYSSNTLYLSNSSYFF